MPSTNPPAGEPVRDLCALVFVFEELTEESVAEASEMTIERVHAFYGCLARNGLFETRATGAWARTAKVAPTLLEFLEQARIAGVDLEKR